MHPLRNLAKADDARDFYRHAFLRVLEELYKPEYELIELARVTLANIKDIPEEIIVQVALGKTNAEQFFKLKPFYQADFGVTVKLLENLLVHRRINV